ncbi:MAG TPA: ATP-dependent DNA helicase [Candidatus Paceibacterota bacterium]
MKLNKAQQQAVDTIEGPVMVIAGPGTGKTSILTLRIANILKLTDTPANSILAITYTDAGVRAIREKLHKIIGDRANEVRIHTFHAFATSVISEYPDHFLHLSDMKQMTDIEQEYIINSIIKDSKFKDLRPSGKPDAYVGSIIRTIDDAKREALTPEMVSQFAKDEIKKIKNDESSISTRGATKGQLKAEAQEQIEKCERTVLFSNVYEKYESQKREAKKMDFNDLIIELLLALRNDELLLRLLQEKYLYIHVDEHQDTNDAQNFIVGIIAEFFDTPNIFIVGDEKQAIYRFQGASVENFLLLQKKWPSMKVISLDTNYRSHQGILDAGFAMIEKNYEEGEYKDLRIKLTSGNGEKSKPIDIVTGENTTATELYLVENLRKILRENPEDTVAIITRRNRDLDRVIRLLESHNIPVSSERSIDIFSHPVGRVFFDLIDYIAHPSNIEALAKTFIAGLWSLTFGKSVEMIGKLRSGQMIDLPVIKEIRAKLLDDGALGFLIHLAQISGFLKVISNDPLYMYVWRGIITLSESLVREGDINDPLKLIEELLQYRLSSERKTIKVSVGAPDVPIQAMTAHGSKGLEFDHVFTMYTTEESWIGKARGASFILPKKRTTDHDIRDIRRLFYVAITRARKHVSVLTSLEESDGKLLSPLRFIDELDSENISHISLKRAQIEEIYISKADGKNSNAILDLTKRVFTEKGLSVTALNHFLECPNKFIYLSILKIPQAPEISAEKGSAMHYALDNVWKIENKTTKSISDKMSEKIIEYFNDSLLGISEKEIAKKELLDNINIVAKCLEDHFKIGVGASVFTESWVEAKLEIPIHGKLDAIVDTGSEVNVFDYKTREAMSINEIKGLTKNSNGNYFRQLVFYKILLENDFRYRHKRIIPSLVFVSPDNKDRCPTITLPIESSDIEKVKSEIKSLVDSVWSGEIVKSRCGERDCEWCGMRQI